MMNKKFCRAVARLAVIAVCLGAGVAMCAITAVDQALSPAALRVDEMASPLGIDDAQPRFSWQLRDSRENARQTAYRLLMASQPSCSSWAMRTCGIADAWPAGSRSGF